MSVHQRKGGTSWAYKIRIPDPEVPGKLKVKMRSGYRRQGDARRGERFELGHTRERDEPEYCYLDPSGVRVAYGPTAHAESFARQQRASVTVRSEIEHYLTTHQDQLSPTTYSGSAADPPATTEFRARTATAQFRARASGIRSELSQAVK